MTFPSITSVDSEEFGGTSSYVMTYPATDDGDLLVWIGSTDGGAEFFSESAISGNANGAGWIKILSQNLGQGCTGIFYLICDGTETGTFTATVGGGAEPGCGIVIRIAAGTWHGTNVPEIDSNNNTYTVGTADWEVVSAFSPSWGSDDTLWFCLSTCDDGIGAASALPSGFSNVGAGYFGLDGVGSTGHAWLGSQELAIASLGWSAVADAWAEIENHNQMIFAVQGAASGSIIPQIMHNRRMQQG